MKKVLLVSPHFPPVNAPDMQRVRLALPYLRAHGWEPTVLAVAPESVEGAVLDPPLERTYPADVRVERIRGVPPARTRWLGFGNLWWRCGRALAAAGERLLREERFDLVFFSTTLFSSFTLGPRWRRELGVPYVLDYQDPWVNDYYARTGAPPPGGRLRFALSQWSAQRDEPQVLREAAGIVAVSEAYAAGLAERYPWFDPARVEVLPFGAAEDDLAVAARHTPRAPLIDFDDGLIHHVYAGRGGADMAPALRLLFRAFRGWREAQPEAAARVRFHFIGTGYAPPPLGEDTVLPVAAAEGVAESVREYRYRVPYFDALHYLQRASALVSVGSDDPTYSPSKIYPYLLARRPLLMLCHERSLALRIATEAESGVRIAFGGAADEAALTEQVRARWFAAEAWRQPATLRAAAFAPYTAAALTARLAAVFDRAI